MNIPSVVKFPESQNQELQSLSFYIKEARNLISFIGNKIRPGLSRAILKDDDAFSYIVYELMKGDCQFDESKSSIRTYRYNRVRWALLKYLTFSTNKKHTYEFDFSPVSVLEYHEANVPNPSKEVE